MVPSDQQAPGRSSSSSTQTDTLPPTDSGAGTPAGEQNEASRLSLVRRRYESEGLPDFIINFLVSSWREGTQLQYEVYVRKWLAFCTEQEISMLNPTVGQILHFLWQLFQGGLGYSGLNTARSALSAWVDLEGAPAGQHPLVKRFIRAAFQQRPALPKNTVVWDVDLVLNYLKSLSPVKLISLKLLTHKLTMLLLLLSGQRQQTIHALNVKNMSLSGSFAKFRIGEVIKQSRPGTHIQELSFKAYAPNRCLCVVTVLREYLKRTLMTRGKETTLLLTYGRPVHAASRASIRRWAVAVLCEAGVDMTIFTPHSTRAASTSLASKHVPLDTIMTTAGWSRASTFRQYYDKPIDRSGSFGQAILSQNDKSKVQPKPKK